MTTVRPLSDELREVAKNELNEVENRVSEDLAVFRSWLEKQPHLKARTDDQFLVSFLRACKWSLEKAKSKIDYYYTIRALMPEIFDNLKFDEKNITICRLGLCVSLPKPLGPGGPRLHLTNYANFDSKKMKMSHLFRYQCLLTEWQIYHDDNYIVSGYIEIVDLSKMTLGITMQFDPVLIKKLAVFLEKGVPIRVKGLHFVNAPKEAQTMLNLAKGLMSEKLKKRFFVHKSLEDLYKIIPKEYLPIEYGGTNGTVAEIQAEMEKKLQSFNEFFEQNQLYGVDEKLRPGKKIQMESLFGIDGTFRKLNID